MTVEAVWVLTGLVVSILISFWVADFLVFGFIIGAFIGLVITSVMKMFNFKFSNSGTYSSSSSNYDDWDD